MELEIVVTNLTKEDIIYILSEGFKCPIWNKNNVLEITNKLLNNENVTIINYRNVKFSMSLYRLYKGVELFIKNGGSTNPCKYNVFECDNIIQYALFGDIIY